MADDIKVEAKRSSGHTDVGIKAPEHTERMLKEINGDLHNMQGKYSSQPKQAPVDEMLAQFGTRELFSRLNATSKSLSRVPLVSESDLTRAISGGSGSFTESEQQTIKFMIAHRTEIAMASNDQWTSETKISLKDVQSYARQNAHSDSPVSPTTAARMQHRETLGARTVDNSNGGKPSTQEICRFAEQNFNKLDINKDHHITRQEVATALNIFDRSESKTGTERTTMESFSGLVDTMQKAHRDQWYWYKDNRGVTLKDVQDYARQDAFNHREIPTSPGDHQIKLIADGREREVLVHIPPNFDKSKTLNNDNPQQKLWISLHPLFANDQEMGEWTNMTKKADQVGAIVMYPNATGWLPEWSPLHLRQWSLNNKATNRTDDLGFVKTVMDVAEQQFGVKKSCVVGFSNGGMLAHEVAANMPERVAAVAIVSSAQCGDLPAPKTAIPVLTMNGTQDPLIPWGGRFYPSALGLGHLKSADATNSFWRSADGATMVSAPVEAYAGVQQTTAVNPTTGDRVIQYKMKSGHCWPGAGSAMFGPLCRTMNATDVIADFFANPSDSIRAGGAAP